MEHIHQINQKQREVFARLIEEAKERAQEVAGSLDVETEVVSKLAQEYGAADLITKVRKLRNEVEETESALEKLGFNCGEDSISVKWNAPKPLQQALEAAKRSARKERDAAFKKYDRAILNIWAAEDAAEAKKIVEELL